MINRNATPWMVGDLSSHSAATTSILDETATLLNARGLHELAVAAGTQLIRSPAVTLLHVDVGLLERGWAYFCRHADKRYSLTDCISFIVMQERGLREALTFDQHFTQAGYAAIPAI